MQDRPAPGKPNSAQIGEARRIAGLAAAVFGGIALVVGLFIALIRFAQELLHRFATQALVYAGIDFAAGLIPLAAAWAVVAIGLVALAKQLDQAIKVLGVIAFEAGAIGGAFVIESYLPDSAYTESGLGTFDNVMVGIISLFGIAMIGMWVIGILSHIPGLVIRGVINNIIGLNLAILAYKFIGEMQSAIYVQGSSGS